MKVLHRTAAILTIALTMSSMAACHHKARDGAMTTPLKPVITREDIERVHAPGT